MSIEAAPADFELIHDGDVWVAVHVDTGVASQGATPSEAVSRAEEAAELSQQDHQPGDDAFQRELLERFRISAEEETETIDTPDGMP